MVLGTWQDLKNKHWSRSLHSCTWEASSERPARHPAVPPSRPTSITELTGPWGSLILGVTQPVLAQDSPLQDSRRVTSQP